MSFFGRVEKDLKTIARDFTLEALAKEFQPKIDEGLKKHAKDRQRKSVLTPLLTVWLTLSLTIRRELSYHNVLDWLVSGFRSLGWMIPRHSVEDGAITHARKRLGMGPFREFFKASAEAVRNLAPDFHGFRSLGMDGTQMTMPNTPENVRRFGKPRCGRSEAAFPQVRMVGLVAVAVQTVFDFAFGPCVGTGTGERSLGMQLVLENAVPGLLFLLDRGFFGFDLLDAISKKGAQWLIRVPAHVKLKPIRKSRRSDGSYLAWLEGKVENPAGPDSRGRKRWIKVQHQVRAIRYQIKGFRPNRVATSLLDEEIAAADLVHHYHRRWEVELAYDSIKTHQSGRRTGQCSTVLRSKIPVLVEQELYAMLTTYNLVRRVVNEAAAKHGIDPLAISFVDALWALIDAIPGMRSARAELLPFLYQQLLDDIARCRLKRRRRPRAYPRVVKVKMSNFKLKRRQHQEIRRDFARETKVLCAVR
jgi:hypothetical protein